MKESCDILARLVDLRRKEEVKPGKKNIRRALRLGHKKDHVNSQQVW